MAEADCSLGQGHRSTSLYSTTTNVVGIIPKLESPHQGEETTPYDKCYFLPHTLGF